MDYRRWNSTWKFFAPVQHMNDGLTINYAFVAAMGFAGVKTVTVTWGITTFVILAEKLQTLLKTFQEVCFCLSRVFQFFILQ